jgi:hypothetical protein
MNIGLLVYLISIVDNMIGLFIGMAVASGIAIVVGFIFKAISIDCRHTSIDEDQLATKAIKIGTIFFSIFLPLSIFSPSSKVVAAMYLLPKVVENDKVRKMPDKVLKLFDAKLDQWVAETLKGNNNK